MTTSATPHTLRRHADRLMLRFNFSLLAFGASFALGWWAITRGHQIALYAAAATAVSTSLYALACWLFLVRTRLHIRRMVAEERPQSAG